MNKIRVIELFAGYGSQHLALKRLKRDYPEFEYEVVAFCEIDENAIKAYHALHGDNIPNLGDITQVNPSDVPDCDLMTWSFPCQSISSAGLQHGLAEGSGTRSSLCWNAVRIFEAKRPKYLLMENVSALVSDKFIGDFNLLQSSLQKIGYTNFTQLMNAKDYGVPQNRLRVFMVSVLDCSQAYYFPKPFPLTRRLKDVLEQNVAERYYLKEEQVQKLMAATQSNEPQDNVMLGWTRSNTGKGDPTYHPVSVANCVTAAKRDNTQNYVVEPQVQQVCNLIGDREGKFANPQRGRIDSPAGLAPAVDTAQGGNLVAKIIEQAKTAHPSRGIIMIKNTPCWVRRLTERELFRLMDVDENDIDTLLNAGISNTQLAKLAGNSVVCACYYHIFHALFIETTPPPNTQTQLF